MKSTIIALTLAVAASVFAPLASANQNGAPVSEAGISKTSPYDRDSAAASQAE